MFDFLCLNGAVHLGLLLFVNQRLTFLCRCVCVCELSSYDELRLGALDLLQTLFSRKHTMTTKLNLIRQGFMFSVSAGPLHQAFMCVCVRSVRIHVHAVIYFVTVHVSAQWI